MGKNEKKKLSRKTKSGEQRVGGGRTRGKAKDQLKKFRGVGTERE